MSTAAATATVTSSATATITAAGSFLPHPRPCCFLPATRRPAILIPAASGPTILIPAASGPTILIPLAHHRPCLCLCLCLCLFLPHPRPAFLLVVILLLGDRDQFLHGHTSFTLCDLSGRTDQRASPPRLLLELGDEAVGDLDIGNGLPALRLVALDRRLGRG